MSAPLIFAIDSLDFKTASVQAGLIASRLNSPELKVRAVDLMASDSSLANTYNQYHKGHYGRPEELSPYDVTNLMGPQIKLLSNEFKLPKSSKPQVVIASGYGSSIMLSQAHKIASQPERYGFYAWCEQYMFDELAISRPVVNILIRSGESDSLYIKELVGLMPKTFTATKGFAEGETSVANLNNQILEIIKYKLDELHELNQRNNTAYQKAGELIWKNHQLASLQGFQAELLVPLGAADIKKSYAKKTVHSFILSDYLEHKAEVVNFYPRNELDLIKTVRRSSYASKSARLIKVAQSNPAGINANYKLKLSGSFSEIYKIIKFLPAKNVKKITVDARLASSDNGDDFYNRHLRVLLAVRTSLSNAQVLSLMPAGSDSVFELEVNYLQLTKILTKLGKNHHLSVITETLLEQLRLSHPLLWGY